MKITVVCSREGNPLFGIDERFDVVRVVADYHKCFFGNITEINYDKDLDSYFTGDDFNEANLYTETLELLSHAHRDRLGRMQGNDPKDLRGNVWTILDAENIIRFICFGNDTMAYDCMTSYISTFYAKNRGGIISLRVVTKYYGLSDDTNDRILRAIPLQMWMGATWSPVA